MTDRGERSTAMRAAITNVLAEHSDGTPGDRGYVADFVTIAEIIGEDGSPWLFILRDVDGITWRQLGMLATAADDTRAALSEGDS